MTTLNSRTNSQRGMPIFNTQLRTVMKDIVACSMADVSTAELTQEIRAVSLPRLRPSNDGLTAAQKSAEGVPGHDVRNASDVDRRGLA